MFDRLQAFFQTLTSEKDEQPFGHGDPRVAVTALCLQVMEADGVVRDSEKAKLRQLLTENYTLSNQELNALLDAGQRAENEAIDYFRFTSDLNRKLDEEQKKHLIGILWDIVYADGDRSELEDHVVWRISELLGVSNREHVMERLDAASRAEPPEKAG
ncbi:TerB family tellurite resistance protein [Agrobacterium sp. ES01]|uniref:tellurite resistance TerB family protein n=1 Tax=Agrobacterium sp. ES01 TaxID=3420714 RepID=UPI003D096113